MTRRFLHTDPWSSLLDAWSEAYPRLRHTISVRDDRLPSKASRATRATQQRRSERGLLGRSRGPLLHLRVHRAPGIPCALDFRRGRNNFAILGLSAPRDRDALSANSA